MISLSKAVDAIYGDEHLVRLITHLEEATDPAILGTKATVNADDLPGLIQDLVREKWVSLRGVAQLRRIAKLVVHLVDVHEERHRRNVLNTVRIEYANPN